MERLNCQCNYTCRCALAALIVSAVLGIITLYDNSYNPDKYLNTKTNYSLLDAITASAKFKFVKLIIPQN